MAGQNVSNIPSESEIPVVYQTLGAPVLTNKLGAADVALLETALKRNVPIVTTNKGLPNQVRSHQNRTIRERYKNVEIMVFPAKQ